MQITPLELAQSYATLARAGVFIPATLTPDGNPGASRGIASQHSFATLAPWACTETLAALSQPARTRALAPEAVPMNPAWKTGTSSGNRDAWCAAVTPAYTVVVWLGNTTGEGLSGLTGVDAAAPLALNLLAAIDQPHPGWTLQQFRNARRPIHPHSHPRHHPFPLHHHPRRRPTIPPQPRPTLIPPTPRPQSKC